MKTLVSGALKVRIVKVQGRRLSRRSALHQARFSDLKKVRDRISPQQNKQLRFERSDWRAAYLECEEWTFLVRQGSAVPLARHGRGGHACAVAR
jgi:hypothetical protein